MAIDTTNFVLPPTARRPNPQPVSALCVGCGSAIYDPFILHVQPDLDWHGKCLKCTKCNRSLGNDMTCFVRDGKAYCREDYFNTFHYRCAGCQQLVSQSDLVFRIRSRTFHLKCFRCAVCEKLLQPGAEIALQDDRVCCLAHSRVPLPTSPGNTKVAGGVQAVPGLVEPSHRLFRNAELEPFPIKRDLDLERVEPAPSPDLHSHNLTELTAVNRSQGAPVSSGHPNTSAELAHDAADSFGFYDTLTFSADRKKNILAVDRVSFGHGTVASKGSVGETDMQESFGNSPSVGPHSCSSSIGVAIRDTDSPLTGSSELSQEDENTSLLGLNNSNQAMSDSGLGAATALPSTHVGPGGVFSPQGYPGPARASLNGRKGSGSSSSCTSGNGPCGDEVVHTIGFGPRTIASHGHCSRSGKSGGSKRSKDPKTTRVRTVLNEKQLHTLRTCYAANPRPDALMKEQLVEMTSLSPRVIRVWFQNKRCKDKKRQILLKQMEQHQQNGNRPSAALHGISLIAGSPIRNEPSLLGTSSAIDIHQVPLAYWKSSAGELHMRPGQFRSASPFGQIKAPASLSPNLSPLLSSQDPPVSQIGEPSLAFPPVSCHTLPGLLSNLGVMTTDHVRFQPPNSRSIGGLVQAAPEFPEEDDESQPVSTSVPAFQQLVSHFEMVGASKLQFPPSSLGYTTKRPPDSFTPIFYPASLNKQIPPNMSLPVSDEIGRTKLDPLVDSIPGVGPSANGSHLYQVTNPTLSGLSPPQAPLSPNTIGLNFLTYTQSQPGNEYVHPDMFLPNQSNVNQAARTPLST